MVALFLALGLAQAAVSPEIAVDPAVRRYPGVARGVVAAWNGKHHLVAFNGYRPQRSLAVRVGADGRPVDRDAMLLGGGIRDTLVASDGEGFVVLDYGDCFPVSDEGVAGEAVRLFPTKPFATARALVFDGSRYAVFYTGGPGDNRLLREYIDGACKPLSTSPDLVATEAFGAVAVASNRSGRQLVAKLKYPLQEVEVISIGPDGATSPQSLGPTAVGAVASDGSGFLVVTHVDRRPRGFRFDASGRRLDATPLKLDDPEARPANWLPTAAYHDGAYSVLMNEELLPGTYSRGLARVPTAPGSPVTHVRTNLASNVHAASSDGTRLLVVTSGGSYASVGYGSVVVSLLEASGAFSAPQPLFEDTGLQQHLRLGSEGTDFHVRWDEATRYQGADHRFVRTDRAGTWRWSASVLVPTRPYQWDPGLSSKDQVLAAPGGALILHKSIGLGGGLGAARIGPSGEQVDAARWDVGWPCESDGSAFRCVQPAPAGGVQLGRLPGTGEPQAPILLSSKPSAGAYLWGYGGGDLLISVSWRECPAGVTEPDQCTNHHETKFIDAGTGATRLLLPQPPADWTGYAPELRWWNGQEFVMLSGFREAQLVSRRVDRSGRFQRSTFPPIQNETESSFAVAPGPPALLTWQKGNDVVASWLADDGRPLQPDGFLIQANATAEAAAASVAGGRAAVGYTRFVSERPYQTTRAFFRLVSSAAEAPDGGATDGGPTDVGATQDAAVVPDRPVAMDAGPSPDAALPADAGVHADQAPALDVPSPQLEAGARDGVDADVLPGTPPSGCSCTTTPGGHSLLPMLSVTVIGLIMRRRRQRH
jgi:uncharacterized protein (TIGR03382 family)